MDKDRAVNKQAANSDRFIAAYNEIDSFMRKTLNADERTPHSVLINEMAKTNRVFLHYKEDLLTFARLRNAIVHNPYMEDADPIAEPHEFIINEYDVIKDKVLNPPMAIDVLAVRAEDIYITNLEASALDVMRVMHNENYTHVPVIESGRLIGVFSENTVFSYLASNGDVMLGKNTPINEFREFIPIGSHRSEYFEFASRNATVIDIEDIFRRDLKDKKRLGVVFITQNGYPGERILGMITAWDVAGYRQL